ncbi:hypothetical protein V1514DRAFT_332159 [Lipomyces japonicus]|uniref:uncharacterized protein n=1 Tax=Lipomyces japonicus TaxID=56871 RepID=UPI0034CFF8F0
MGSALSKAPTRRYPTTVSRAGLDQVARPTARPPPPLQGEITNLPSTEPPKLGELAREVPIPSRLGLKDVPAPYPVKDLLLGNPGRDSRDPDLDALVGDGYDARLGAMLRLVGPVSVNAESSSRQIVHNPMLKLYKVRKDLEGQAAAEQRSQLVDGNNQSAISNKFRSLLQSDEIVQLLDATARGVNGKELQKKFNLANGVVDRLVTAYVNFVPAESVDATKSTANHASASLQQQKNQQVDTDDLFAGQKGHLDDFLENLDKQENSQLNSKQKN